MYYILKDQGWFRIKSLKTFALWRGLCGHFSVQPSVWVWKPVRNRRTWEGNCKRQAGTFRKQRDPKTDLSPLWFYQLRKWMVTVVVNKFKEIILDHTVAHTAVHVAGAKECCSSWHLASGSLQEVEVIHGLPKISNRYIPWRVLAFIFHFFFSRSLPLHS